MAKLSDSDLIQRYLYLGTDQPFYIHENKPLDIAEARRILQPVETQVLGTSPGADEAMQELARSVSLKEQPLDLVVKAWNSGALVRHDECLFTLAYLARTYRLPEHKHTVYEVIPKLIERSEDLFLFVHFYLSLAKQDARLKGNGFGNGMKVALKKWYDKHSSQDLAQLLAVDRGHLKWSHKDLLVMLHLNLADEGKMQVIDAAVGGIGRKRPPKPKIDGSAKKPKSASPEPSTSTKPAEDVETKKEDQPKDEDSGALNTYRRIKEFKASEDAQTVLSKTFGFRYPMHIVPSQLQRAPMIWVKYLPHMPYKDVVKSALVLQDYKLLKDPSSELAIVYGRALNCMTAVKTSKISPIYIYQIMRLFEERQRYLNVVKEAVHTANNLALKNAAANPVVMRQFYQALNQAMLNYQRTGLRFFVTLDLRSKQSKKRVFGNRLMSCQAAFVLLALPMYKQETQITIKSFTEQSNVLSDVNFTREMEFFQGCDHIQAIASKKTKVDICQPMNEARSSKANVDVFLTIVDSLIRVNPKRTSPALALSAYNAESKNKAVYIIVSLSRHSQDFQHKDKTSNGRVLEVVGCTEDTPKIIDAYIKNHFQ